MSVIGYWLTLNERGGEGHVLWQSPKTMQHLCDINDLYLKKVIHCDWDYPKIWMLIAKPFEIFPRLKPTLVFEIIEKIIKLMSLYLNIGCGNNFEIIKIG